jgi:tetratricopeptide (TPR) repeat protein
MAFGSMYRKTGDVTKAIPIFQEALQNMRVIKSPLTIADYGLTRNYLYELGYAYWDSGLVSEAIDSWKKALVLADMTGKGSENDVLSLRTRANIAVAYRDLGLLQEAEEVLPDVIRQTQHPAEKLLYQNNLALVYHLQGHHKKAQELFQRTIADLTRIIGRNNWVTTVTLHNFACLQETLGHDDEAIDTLTETFSLKTSAVGLRYPGTFKTALFLGKRVQTSIYTKWSLPLIKYS